MSREIKFRIWHTKQKFMSSLWQIDWEHNIVMHNKRKPSDLRDTILLQFTGLKDAKGVEIYEGDIVEWREIYSYVYWNQKLARFILKTKDDKKCLIPSGFTQQVNVVGNIYENPELLEE